MLSLSLSLSLSHLLLARHLARALIKPSLDLSVVRLSPLGVLLPYGAYDLNEAGLGEGGLLVARIAERLGGGGGGGRLSVCIPGRVGLEVVLLESKLLGVC